MKIEDIKVDEDVIQFVSEYQQSLFMSWPKVSFNDLNGMFSQNNRKRKAIYFF